MVKLTPDLIEQAAQHTNPVRDRELDLRGYKIPVIECLGATLDQFDTIDFSDNDIRKLDGFPLLPRLKTLLFNNNRICRLVEGTEDSLPNLEMLILTNNSLQELGDIDPLKNFSKLSHLSLLRNPITAKKHYRLYVIWRLPQLQRLDFRRIRLVEREAAVDMFKGKKGKQFAAEIGKRTKTFTPGEPANDTTGVPPPSKAPANQATREEVEAIKTAIAGASTLGEMEFLNQMLQSGQVPGLKKSSETSRNHQNGETEETEEEEMETQ